LAPRWCCSFFFFLWKDMQFVGGWKQMIFYCNGVGDMMWDMQVVLLYPWFLCFTSSCVFGRGSVNTQLYPTHGCLILGSIKYNKWSGAIFCPFFEMRWGCDQWMDICDVPALVSGAGLSWTYWCITQIGGIFLSFLGVTKRGGFSSLL